ncbi:hypothetical protein DCO58_09455 [Helicobacter saguini]|uniref:RDD domain-containing protein n=2 Tax=Helicobacter saguini TaxID=1548018 RepID=A0A347VTV9_9HELI|nr:hypothetical protein [Helicobacter saguini]MWV67872.1 hypothetical protein [Helicobacter saguini]MWV70659.1 hypothetical protein [Helicobacter saguini]MWV72564.1 hypothetical protein [Helicobacter saguini]TLD94823.1 hypothetical protein LS64_004040 [Helicobacter saguini]
MESKNTKISKNNFLIARLKAFITDMFLINMPILYFTTYVIVGDKNSFQANQIAILCCGLSYAFILVLFFYFSGQTPGFRYAEIMLVKDSKNTNNIESKLGNLEDSKKSTQDSKNIESNHTQDSKKSIQDSKNIESNHTITMKDSKNTESKPQKPSFLQCVIFVFSWLVEITFFLWVFALLRKDKKTLHELLSGTKIIYKKNTRKQPT